MENGAPESGLLYEDAEMCIGVERKAENEFEMLLGKNEKVEIVTEYDECVEAPVSQGEKIGTVTYYLGEECLKEYQIVATETIYEKDVRWYFTKIVECYVNNKMA